MRVLHGRPERHAIRHLFSEFSSWSAFMRVGWPLLLGSLFLAIPCALATYVVMRLLVSRARSDQARAGR